MFSRHTIGLLYIIHFPTNALFQQVQEVSVEYTHCRPYGNPSSSCADILLASLRGSTSRTDPTCRCDVNFEIKHKLEV